MDDEIEIDDINLIVVAVLTKTGPNNYQILRKAWKTDNKIIQMQKSHSKTCMLRRIITAVFIKCSVKSAWKPILRKTYDSDCQKMSQGKGSHPKKTGKKVHNSCELSPKMENPPSPYFTNISATFRTWKSMFFLQLLRVCELGGLTKTR